MALDPISGLLEIGSKIIDRLWPDPVQQASAKLELLKMQQNGELQKISEQLSINQVEAANPNVFVSGWRPAIGWVCATGLFTQFIIAPLSTWASTLIGHPVIFPTLDMGTLMTLLTGMLGIAGLRTTEKIKGVA